MNLSRWSPFIIVGRNLIIFWDIGKSRNSHIWHVCMQSTSCCYNCVQRYRTKSHHSFLLVPVYKYIMAVLMFENSVLVLLGQKRVVDDKTT